MRRRVLVVDDEHMCTLFLSTLLSQEGYEVKSSGRGDEAIEIGLEFEPEVLVTDWMLKDTKDGIDVARRLREEFPSLQVIFITGMSAEMLEAKAQEIKEIVILEKPIDFNALLTAIS